MFHRQLIRRHFCSIGIAYAGTERLDLLERIMPVVYDTGLSMEISSMAALALGFIFVGSANGDVAGTFLQALMERSEKELDEKWTRYLALALALLYLGMLLICDRRWTCTYEHVQANKTHPMLQSKHSRPSNIPSQSPLRS